VGNFYVLVPIKIATVLGIALHLEFFRLISNGGSRDQKTITCRDSCVAVAVLMVSIRLVMKIRGAKAG